MDSKLIWCFLHKLKQVLEKMSLVAKGIQETTSGSKRLRANTSEYKPMGYACIAQTCSQNIESPLCPTNEGKLRRVYCFPFIWIWPSESEKYFGTRPFPTTLANWPFVPGCGSSTLLELTSWAKCNQSVIFRIPRTTPGHGMQTSFPIEARSHVLGSKQISKSGNAMWVREKQMVERHLQNKSIS